MANPKAIDLEILKALTDKEKLFVLEYLSSNCNGTEAAIKAYDTDDRVTAAAIAYENLRKPHIAAAIEAWLNTYAMTAAEAVKRMADYARADISEFETAGGIDFEAMKEAGLGFMLKGIKRKGKNGEAVEYEFHDQFKATENFLRLHGKFGAKGTDDDPVHHAVEIVRKVIKVDKPE